MKIALDVDGVLYDFVDTFRRYIYDQTGVMPPEVTTWHWWDEWGMSKKDWRYHYGQQVREGWWLMGYPIPGAIQGVAALRRQGHDLVACTNRHTSHDSMSQTWTWVMRTFPQIDDIYHAAEDKTEHEWDLLIDDRPRNIQHALEAGRQAILFDQPWNEQDTQAVPRGTWATIPGLIRQIEQQAVTA